MSWYWLLNRNRLRAGYWRNVSVLYRTTFAIRNENISIERMEFEIGLDNGQKLHLSLTWWWQACLQLATVQTTWRLMHDNLPSISIFWIPDAHTVQSTFSTVLRYELRMQVDTNIIIYDEQQFRFRRVFNWFVNSCDLSVDVMMTMRVHVTHNKF